MSSKLLAVVPARSGSVRLPNKNLMEFGGVPLYRRAVDVALDAGLDVVVTTDDARICVPVDVRVRIEIRPGFLSGPSACVWDAVEHVCYRDNYFGPVVLLQPTSPLRELHDVEVCIRLALDGRNVTSVVGSDGRYRPNGAVYVRHWKRWGDIGRFYEMPESRSVDIDTQADFDRALRLWHVGATK